MLGIQNSATDTDQSPVAGRTWRSFLLPFIIFGCAVLAMAVQKFRLTGQPPFLHRESVWSVAIYEGPSPLELSPTSADGRPMLSAADVTDIPALFVADPFMIQDDNQWFMFMEVMNRDTQQGDIALATSPDGLQWNYAGIVLDEPHHLSYPLVFKFDDQWYLLPQSDVGVELYRAEEFPHRWKRVHTILRGSQLADPTLFQHDDLWWMFVGKSATHDELRLFYATDLLSDWTEHPQSPLITANAEISRPGGRIIRWDESLIRLAQDCAPKYGNQLRGFRITKLTTTEYSEEPIAQEVILKGGSHDWNSKGMHHCDAHQIEPDLWRAAVDGHRKTWILQATP